LDPFAVFKNIFKIPLKTQTAAFGKAEILHKTAHLTTVMAFLPFALRALSTRLPPAVAILARKPMCFALFALFGLYVGNIVY